MLKLHCEQSEEAFQIFYDYYSPALFGVIIKITRNEGTAYIALKAAFKEIWLTKSTLHNRAHLFLWMLDVAERCALEERYPKKIL